MFSHEPGLNIRGTWIEGVFLWKIFYLHLTPLAVTAVNGQLQEAEIDHQSRRQNLKHRRGCQPEQQQSEKIAIFTKICHCCSRFGKYNTNSQWHQHPLQLITFYSGGFTVHSSNAGSSFCDSPFRFSAAFYQTLFLESTPRALQLLFIAHPAEHVSSLVTGPSPHSPALPSSFEHPSYLDSSFYQPF